MKPQPHISKSNAVDAPEQQQQYHHHQGGGGGINCGGSALSTSAATTGDPSSGQTVAAATIKTTIGPPPSNASLQQQHLPLQQLGYSGRELYLSQHRGAVMRTPSVVSFAPTHPIEASSFIITPPQQSPNPPHLFG